MFCPVGGGGGAEASGGWGILATGGGSGGGAMVASQSRSCRFDCSAPQIIIIIKAGKKFLSKLQSGQVVNVRTYLIDKCPKKSSLLYTFKKCARKKKVKKLKFQFLINNVVMQ